ncbi:MAG: hypothetical protein AB1898_01655 [Acidobacteriota bacterium]
MKERIVRELAALKRPYLTRDGVRLGSLEQIDFDLVWLGEHLALSCQLASGRICRRIVGVQVNEREEILLETRHWNRVEIFQVHAEERQSAGQGNPVGKTFQKCVTAIIQRNFPGSRIRRVSSHSDLEHSLSANYVRLLFSAAGREWMAVAVHPLQSQTVVNGILSQGIIWRDYLRRSQRKAPSHLLYLVPAGQAAALKYRLPWIRGAGTHIHLAGLDLQTDGISFLDVSDSGNLATVLTQVRPWHSNCDLASHAAMQRLTELAPGNIEVVRRPGSRVVSFRIRGLEIAQGDLSRPASLRYGLNRSKPLQTEDDWKEMGEWVERILSQRCVRPQDPSSPEFRLQAERWLESLILQDVRRIDASFDPQHVYPQVPAYLAGDRGVIDILTVTRRGRLAVIELKVAEDLDLPFQGLDYWLRVRWHQERKEFTRRGYFHKIELSPGVPLLYFVCPQFRYHDSFPVTAGCIDSRVPIVQVGINENWRAGVQVLTRRLLNGSVD